MILGGEIPVLDHGFVRVVDWMGDDSSPVQAARVSYGAGTKTKRADEKLIKYLMRNRHMTPFEMCEIKFHVKLPIFVARQWIRHRTANVNEYSGRYSEMGSDFYVPDKEDIKYQSKTNKQGGDDEVPELIAAETCNLIRAASINSWETYKCLLDHDIARETARMVLGTNFYTEWYWKIDLRNLFNFLALRTDSHAQFEMRQYAHVIDKIVQDWVPVCHAAYKEHYVA